MLLLSKYSMYIGKKILGNTRSIIVKGTSLNQHVQIRWVAGHVRIGDSTLTMTNGMDIEHLKSVPVAITLPPNTDLYGIGGEIEILVS